MMTRQKNRSLIREFHETYKYLEWGGGDIEVLNIKTSGRRSSRYAVRKHKEIRMFRVWGFRVSERYSEVSIRLGWDATSYFTKFQTLEDERSTQCRNLGHQTPSDTASDPRGRETAIKLWINQSCNHKSQAAFVTVLVLTIDEQCPAGLITESKFGHLSRQKLRQTWLDGKIATWVWIGSCRQQHAKR